MLKIKIERIIEIGDVKLPAGTFEQEIRSNEGSEVRTLLRIIEAITKK